MHTAILRAIELANEQHERMEGLTVDGRAAFMKTEFESLISMKITTLLRLGYIESIQD